MSQAPNVAGAESVVSGGDFPPVLVAAPITGTTADAAGPRNTAADLLFCMASSAQVVSVIDAIEVADLEAVKR